MPTLKIRSDINHTYGDAIRHPQTNTYFVDYVSNVISGLRKDDAKLVIVTRQSRKAIEENLRKKLGEFDYGDVIGHETCAFIEAEDLLERITIDGWPSKTRLNDVIGSIMARMQQAGTARIHVFGETVSLLCAKGKSDAAIYLETLWDALAANPSLSFPSKSLLSALFNRESEKAANDDLPSLLREVQGKAEGTSCSIGSDGLASFLRDGQPRPTVAAGAIGSDVQAHDKLEQIGRELENEIKLRKALEQKLLEHERQLAEKTAALEDADARLNAEISGRKEVEKNLAHLQKIQEITQKISHLGSWEFIDPETGTIKGSDEFYRICGLEPQSRTIDLAFAQSIVHPQDKAKSDAAIQATIEQNVPYLIEKRIIRPDGSVRHVISQGQLLFDENNEFETAIGCYLDITELKQAEEDLRRSHEELRRLAIHQEKIKEKEQKRIAQELHDELGGLLTGVKAYISTAMDDPSPQSGRAGQLLKEAVGIVDMALDSIRRIVNDLHPSVLDYLGLWGALKWYGERITQGTDLICTFFIDKAAQSTAFGLEESTMLFRICQEALTNIVRHSKATQITISATVDANSLTIKIEDNGVGFNAGRRVNRESMGITGMGERALYLGGKINIASSAGKGTTVELSLPLNQAPKASE
jgi:PAS domain S-box-containing protein